MKVVTLIQLITVTNVATSDVSYAGGIRHGLAPSAPPAVGAEPWPKLNFVKSKCKRSHLVACIALNFVDQIPGFSGLKFVINML